MVKRRRILSKLEAKFITLNMLHNKIFQKNKTVMGVVRLLPLLGYKNFPGIKKMEVDGFVQDMDIAPTILELIGEQANEEWKFDGKSMINLIKNNEEIRDKVLFYDGLGEDVRGVRTKDRKVIFAKAPKCHLCKGSHHKEWEEYDLKNDPGENNNIYLKVGPLSGIII